MYMYIKLLICKINGVTLWGPKKKKYFLNPINYKLSLNPINNEYSSIILIRNIL